MTANADGTVNIHGKQYKPVALRISEFREAFQAYTIMTELITADDDRVVIKATIADEELRVIATGYAEEVRGSTNINKTSALENAETSAVGRALAFFGLAGTEIASADEVANAINQQTEKDLYASFAKTTAANEVERASLVAIRDFLADENFDAARECWNEVDHDSQRAIWVATSKGGWFTTRERQQMKFWSNEFELKRERK